MFKFIHAADLHLDSPLKGLERYEGAPVAEMRDAPRRALEALVETAIAEQVAFVLIAGDVYDGNWRDYKTGLFFISQMARLREADIPVFVIAGNHDAANKMTRSLKLPDNVAYLGHHRPESMELEELGVVVHGQGFATAAVFDDLSLEYPAARRGFFNIGLLHTCASGRDCTHQRYAPCTIEGLSAKGYDYWALGHIHAREVLSQSPYIAFAGNLQGRHVGEAGPKGCLLVTVDDKQQAAVEFRPLDVVRWQRVNVELGSSAGMDDALALVAVELARASQSADGRTLAVRVELRGRSAAHPALAANRPRLANQIRAAAADVGSGNVWIEKVVLSTESPSRLEANLDGPIGTLKAVLAELRADPARLEEIVDFSDLQSRLPAELTEAGGTRLDAAEALISILDEAEPLLVERLVRKQEQA